LFLLPCCIRYCAFSPHALLFLKYRLVFLASHLATLMPCYFWSIALFFLHHTLLLSCLAPCCFHALHLVAFMLYTLLFLCLIALHCHALFLSHHTLLFSCLATPLCHALFFLHCALLFLFSYFATLILTPCYLRHFIVHTLLPCHCTLLFYLLITRPCCPTIVFCYSPFSSTSCPPTPLLFCCICSLSQLVALPSLLIFHPHFLV
jgi:hypothetical protein